MLHAWSYLSLIMHHFGSCYNFHICSYILACPNVYSYLWGSLLQVLLVVWVLLKDCTGSSASKNVANKSLASGANLDRKKIQTAQHSALTWTEKYRPKVPNDIIGNQSLVCVGYHFAAGHSLSYAL